MKLHWLAIKTGCLCSMVALSSLSCMATKFGRPAWVVSRQHEDFPLDRFTVGAGEGGDLDRAETVARLDLEQQLRIRLQNTKGSLLATAMENGSFQPDLADPQRMTLLDLDQAKIGVSWSSRSKEHAAVLAVMDHAALARVASVRVQSLDRSVSKLILSAEQTLIKERRPYLSLIQYLTALSTLLQIQDELLLLTYLGIKEYPPLSAPSIPNLQQKISWLISGIQIRILSGDEQALESDGQPRTPLSLVVEFAQDQIWAPISGINIGFRGVSIDFKPFSLPSDNQGTIQTKLPDQVTPPSSFEIIAGIDAKSILQQADLWSLKDRFPQPISQLENIQVRFHFNQHQKTRCRALVIIQEIRSGEPSNRLVLAKGLTSQLQAMGFELVDPAPYYSQIDVEDSSSQAIAPARASAEILIIGRVEARLSKKVASDFVFAQAEGEIKTIRTDSATVFATFKEPAKAAGTDEANATERALRNFGQNTTRVLADAIRNQKDLPCN
jgi:hypothetical protein